MAKDLNYFKKKIMAILEKQTDDATAEINKSLNQMDFIYSQMNPSTFSEIEKSRGYGIGTVREWKGRKYKKIAPNKWRLVYESNSRGAKQSIAYLKKAVMNAKSTDELLQIVMENVNRFQDANGKTLDIVSELQEAVRSAKTALNGKKETAAEPKKEHSAISDKELEEKNKNLEAERNKIAADIKDGKDVKENGRKLTEVNNEKEKVVNEMAQRKFDAADEEEPKPEPKKEEPKQEEKPAEEPKKEDETAKEDIKKQKKALKDLADDFYAKTYHEIAMAKRAGTDASIKAIHYMHAVENLANFKDKIAEATGKKDLPDFPADVVDKVNELKKMAEGKNFYWLGRDAYKGVTGIRSNKITDVLDAYAKAISEKYKEYTASDEKVPNKVEPVAGKTNKEHAELFEMRKNPNNEDEEILYYNGKPYGADGNKGYMWAKPLAEQREMVEAVGMDPKAQAEWVWNKFESNPDEVGYQWSFDSSIKKYGEKKLRELAKPTMSNEEFKEKLLKECEKNTHTYKWIAGQVRGQLYNKRVEETAKKYLDKLTSSTSAINDVDIPVDPKDMEEAESIIGADVKRILDGRDYYGNTKQGLPDKIRRRVRNNPGVARAMFVYIKQEQERTGKTVFTPKHSIWEEFSKLNENAMNSVLNGESETKGGTSSNMYKGDGISSVVEDKDAGRYQITFTGKPDYDTRTILKQNGFRWAPSLGVWQCFNTAHGENSLKRVADALGWEKEEA